MSIPFFQKNTKISFSSISNIWLPQSMEISDIFTGISEEGYCIDQTVSSIFRRAPPYFSLCHNITPSPQSSPGSLPGAPA